MSARQLQPSVWLTLSYPVPLAKDLTPRFLSTGTSSRVLGSGCVGNALFVENCPFLQGIRLLSAAGCLISPPQGWKNHLWQHLAVPCATP